MKGKCSLAIPTLIFKANSYRASVLRKVDTYLRIGGGILDGVVQKNQKQLMQRGLIADIGNLLVQVADDGNARARGATSAQASSRISLRETGSLSRCSCPASAIESVNNPSTIRVSFFNSSSMAASVFRYSSAVRGLERINSVSP